MSALHATCVHSQIKVSPLKVQSHCCICSQMRASLVHLYSLPNHLRFLLIFVDFFVCQIAFCGFDFFPFACPVMEIEGSDMWVHLLGSSDSEGFVIQVHCSGNRWCCLILSGIMMLAVVQGLNSSSCEEREERKGVEKGKKKKLITRIHLRRRCTVVCHSYLTRYIA